MKLIREYDFAGSHYGLVELDDGSKMEIKDKDPLVKAAEMVIAGVFIASKPEYDRKTIADFSDAELVIEVDRRSIKRVVRGVVVA